MGVRTIGRVERLSTVDHGLQLQAGLLQGGDTGIEVAEMMLQQTEDMLAGRFARFDVTPPATNEDPKPSRAQRAASASSRSSTLRLIPPPRSRSLVSQRLQHAFIRRRCRIIEVSTSVQPHGDEGGQLGRSTPPFVDHNRARDRIM